MFDSAFYATHTPIGFSLSLVGIFFHFRFLLDEIMARYGTPDDQVSNEYDGPAKIQLKKAKDTDSDKAKKCSC